MLVLVFSLHDCFYCCSPEEFFPQSCGPRLLLLLYLTNVLVCVPVAPSSVCVCLVCVSFWPVIGWGWFFRPDLACDWSGPRSTVFAARVIGRDPARWFLRRRHFLPAWSVIGPTRRFFRPRVFPPLPFPTSLQAIPTTSFSPSRQAIPATSFSPPA